MTYVKAKNGQDKKKAISDNKRFFIGEEKTTEIKSKPIDENLINRKDVLARINQMAIKSEIEDLKTYNPALYEDEFLSIPIKFFPGINAKVAFKIIFATWKRDSSVKELSSISGQYAKMLQVFRDLGFVADKAEGNSNFYSNPNFRKFVGWKHPRLENKDYLPISPKKRRLVLKNKRDYLTHSRKSIEIDHRTPVNACKKLNIEPAILTNELLESEDFDVNKDFQFITRSRNAHKREVCAKCIAGKDIALPEIALDLEKYNGKYKRRWDSLNEETKSCVGCFYYDPKITQDMYLEENKPTSQILVKKTLKKEKELSESLQKLKDHFDKLRL